MQTKRTISKLTDDLMSDLDKIRGGTMDAKTANTICRHSNVVMRTENIKLQYARIDERVARNVIKGV